MNDVWQFRILKDALSREWIETAWRRRGDGVEIAY